MKTKRAFLFFVVCMCFICGCKTTGSIVLADLEKQQEETIILSEKIVEKSSGIVADLKTIETTAGNLEPVIKAVRVKAEKLEVTAVKLTESLAVEREITGKAQIVVAETEKKADQYKRQRDALGGVFAGIILVIVIIFAFFLVKKYGLRIPI